MNRVIALLSLVLACVGAQAAVAAPLKLERVVLVMRHGIRPPVATNAAIAKYAAQSWPEWAVAPGELTPHGAKTVELMGNTLRADFRRAGLLPSRGCPGARDIYVWADNADQRTRRTGEILAETLAPGCEVKALWWQATGRDPLFFAPPQAECKLDPDAQRAAMDAAMGPQGLETPATRSALAKLQSVLAPDACRGGPGTCLAGKDEIGPIPFGPGNSGPLVTAAPLAEDIFLEYVDGKPLPQVGWGKVRNAGQVTELLPVHERVFELMRRSSYADDRFGAPMARWVLAILNGEPAGAVPGGVKVAALAGHDANLSIMAGVFGLGWTLPGQADATAPSTALAFELWRNGRGGRLYVRPVVYYETIDQLRTLSPARGHALPLRFAGCDAGPMRSCALDALTQKVEAAIPTGCGVLTAADDRKSEPQP